MGVYNGVNSFFNENLYFCTHEFLPMTRKKIKKSINKTQQMKFFFQKSFHLIVHCSTRLQSMSIFSGEGT